VRGESGLPLPPGTPDFALERTRYYRHTGPEVIGLKELKVFRSISASSGAAKYYLTARTEAKFRAIGAEKGYPFYFVTVSSELRTKKGKRTKEVFQALA
jgi:hypothetical protein